MIRRLALLPLALVAGCLYVGSRNDPPSVTLELSPSLAYRGEAIVAGVAIEDDQHDVALVRQRVQIRVLDANQSPIDDNCIATVVPNASYTQLFIFQTGDFFVSADTSDEWGAVSSTLARLHVSDSPPAFTPGAFAEATSPLNGCRTYIAGQAIVVDLRGSASDPDGKPDQTAGMSCPVLDETLSYTWSVTKAPQGAQPRLGLVVAGGCPGAADDSGPTLVVADGGAQICLYTDPNGASDTSASYTLTLSVSDSFNPPVAIAQPAILPVRSDQPACILGSEPGAGLRVVDRTAPQTFTLTGVTDDLDPYPSDQLRFVWSVWRTSDPVWRAVDDDQPDYQLDTSGYDVGEDVQVRAEVVDRTGSRASCALDVAQCLESSCVVATPNSCMRWMTWSLELR
jgi:hypothetical protein